jgi:AraC family L-rhamnose operon regulatory protein RhaS
VLDVAALDPGRVPAGRLELDPALAGKVEGAVRRMLFEQTLDQPQSGAVVVSLALRMVAELMRIDERADAKVQGYVPAEGRGDSAARVRCYIEDLEDHFFEASNLDAAAAGLGLSRRRFTQLFREVTGASWLTYLRRLRVGHARRLLDQTSRTVLSIAFECGFEDLSTFYRAFKREVGVSPNQWRTRQRNAN